ncbi:DUF408 domain protein [Phialemonium atrogriseum]|uniref:RNA polymerase II subunit B1 CTD phosphatase RPAP2 homolog n=1 Tax=Phialemonium atrogriseum TaxID=1093897 RepID=A0AAJ0C3F9_9PEZI|nr:DUF408 domain protein [Phialemonium atrogriseum]KAK1767992.1 DUF408 domain protein [Phialemonium atrogriseum]
MVSEPKKPKGILKERRDPAPPASSSTPPKTKAEFERIALQHARIIEQRKEIQTDVFEAIDALTEFPPAHNGGAVFPASRPAPADVARFVELVRLFQPGDYDDLIEERNILGRCGYALCPNPRRALPGGGEFRFVNKNRDDFGIVRRAELERWCADQCARRALYIKVQLNETPAWERVGLPNLHIELLEEDRAESDPDAELARDLSRLKLEQDRKAAEDSAALALERGDAAKPSPRRPLKVTIREKTVTTEATPPEIQSSAPDQDGHLILEGHKTQFGQ